MDSFRCSSIASGGYGDSDSLSLLRVLGTVDRAGGDMEDRRPVSDTLVRRGECADAPRLRARRWPSPRSRSGTGDGDEDATAELEFAVPVKLSLLSGVAMPGDDADETDSPAAFLNIDRSESFPRSRPGVDDIDGTELSASVPADRGRRDDENDGRPEDLTG